MALEGDVKTPLGTMKKKTLAIVGVGGVGILAIIWYRSKKAAGASSSSTDTSSSQTGTDQNIDPATGFPYGSPEDVAALQQQGLSSGQFGPVFGGGTQGGSQPGTPGSFTTNAQWSQYAEDYLVNTVGLSASDVGNALGKYITAGPVTSDMVTIINQAIAFAGPAPVPGINGMPPAFNEVGGGPGPGGNATNPVGGLHASPGYTGVDIEWQSSAGATSYTVTGKGFSNSPQTIQAPNTLARLSNGKGGHTYTVTVLANPAASGATPASVTFKLRG